MNCRGRGVYMSRQPLLHSEDLLLHNWGEQVKILFRGESVYHVGSSLDKKDYRDVDVRVLLDDDAFERLETHFDTEYLRLAISLWGQKVTGLPIDFDVQPRTFANESFKGFRNCISIKHSAVYETIRRERRIKDEATDLASEHQTKAQASPPELLKTNVINKEK